MVLAAGHGSRVEEEFPKQFVKVGGVPILARTLRVLQQSPSVSAIACAVPEGWKERVVGYRERWGIDKLSQVVVGGRTGLESLWLALRACEDLAAEVVLVHDGVRPLVTERVVEANVALAREHLAVVTAVPLGETLVQSDGASSSDMVARDGLWRVQTPQTFRRGVLEGMLSRVSDWERVSQPSAFALHMAEGGSVRIVDGSEANLKVTYPEDILFLQSMLEG